ncbi:hypothetical protein ADENT20671_2187 [Actinomyces denticolens]|nr:hypothetical protein ADENT20671_2187 [Actinomyces denticolens]
MARDASFAAVALDAVGMRAEALAVLRRLAALQLPDGGFEARYNAVGQVPDGRSRQEDGAGWFLWALGRIIAGARIETGRAGPQSPQPAPADLGLPSDLAATAARAADRLMSLTSTLTRLPPAGPDYWEVPERRTTLGLAAPVLLGLEGALALTDSLPADRVDAAGAPVRPSAGPRRPPRAAMRSPGGSTRSGPPSSPPSAPAGVVTCATMTWTPRSRSSARPSPAPSRAARGSVPGPGRG